MEPSNSPENPDRSSVPNLHTIDAETGKITPGISYTPGDFRGGQTRGLFLPMGSARNPQIEGASVNRGKVTALGLAGSCGYRSCVIGSTEEPGLWCEVLFVAGLSGDAGPFFTLDGTLDLRKIAFGAFSEPNLFAGRTPPEAVHSRGQALYVAGKVYYLDEETKLRVAAIGSFLAALALAACSEKIGSLSVSSFAVTQRDLLSVGEPVTYPAAS